METVTSVDNLRESIASAKAGKQTIGFVPTMGALHPGHTSLIAQSKAECGVTVCSVFVNPTQFNDPGDFSRYPRNLERDTEILKSAGCDILFAPAVTDIYPEPDTRNYELGDLGSRLEGAYRPGHFAGVASVVMRLFDVVGPQKAYFGLKDYQQYLIVKRLAARLKPEIDVVGCEIVRDMDGMALSSRNQLLSPAERSAGLHLSKALMAMQAASGRVSIPELLQKGWEILSAAHGLKVEYLVLADAEQLTEINEPYWDRPIRALVAAYAGEVRLIDNIAIN